jgi:hypothetical protein
MSTGLGGSTFQVKADPTLFIAGMKRAKEEATRGTQQIANNLTQMNDRGGAQLDKMGASAELTAKSIKKIADGAGIGKSSKFGLGLMQVGYMVDDLQYGFKSIVNNIPQMVYMFGGGAGLAGGIGIAAVAISQLINHWDQLNDMVRARWLNVAATDLERVRLAAEKAGASFDDLMKVPNEAGAKEVAKIKEAMIERQAGGAQGVFKGVAQAVANEPSMRAEEDEAAKQKRAALMGIEPVAGPAGDQLRKHIADDLHALNIALNEANNKKASQLLGTAMLAGEEGATARNQLRMLINKYAGSFSTEFIKAMQRTIPTIIQGELDLEHRKQDRDRSRMVAGQLLQGPLGTDMMIGGNQGGPASAAFLEGLTKKGARRFGGVRPEMIEQMAKAELTEEQARSVIGKMNPKATYERGKQLSQKLGVPLGELGQVDGRVLMQAMRELFTEAMKEVAKAGPGGMQGKIAGAMKKAGAQGDPKDVEAEMHAQIRDRIKNLMLERGLTEQQAKRQMLMEQQQRAFGGGIPSQFVGMVQFSKMIQTGALNQGGDIPKRSLEELMAIRKAILNAPKNQGAVAAPPN